MALISMSWSGRMQVAALFIGTVLSAVILIADDRTVDSPSPELDNTLLLKKTADTIRMELTLKGLKETLNEPVGLESADARAKAMALARKLSAVSEP
jgi:hypothetical protein